MATSRNCFSFYLRGLPEFFEIFSCFSSAIRLVVVWINRIDNFKMYLENLHSPMNSKLPSFQLPDFVTYTELGHTLRCTYRHETWRNVKASVNWKTKKIDVLKKMWRQRKIKKRFLLIFLLLINSKNRKISECIMQG